MKCDNPRLRQKHELYMVFMYYTFICIVLLPIYTFKKRKPLYTFIEQITQLVTRDNVFNLYR